MSAFDNYLFSFMRAFLVFWEETIMFGSSHYYTDRWSCQEITIICALLRVNLVINYTILHTNFCDCYRMTLHNDDTYTKQLFLIIFQLIKCLNSVVTKSGIKILVQFIIVAWVADILWTYNSCDCDLYCFFIFRSFVEIL